jgi:hypothetical protein
MGAILGGRQECQVETIYLSISYDKLTGLSCRNRRPPGLPTGKAIVSGNWYEELSRGLTPAKNEKPQANGG